MPTTPHTYLLRPQPMKPVHREAAVCPFDLRGLQVQDHPGLQCETVAQKQQYTVKGSGAAGLCAEEAACVSLGFLFIEQADRQRFTSFLRNLAR